MARLPLECPFLRPGKRFRSASASRSEKAPTTKPFLISWRSQQELARSLGWKCTLMIWGGPALALLSLYFFRGIKNLF